MALDRVKTRANAEKLLRANRIQEAIRELQKLAEDNPHDIQTLNQIGNLYLRLGNKEAAVPMFIKVAELFAKNGFATKAVASLKIVTREQPENLSAWQMLASLSEQQGFAREAWAAYEKVAELVGRAGNLEGTIAVQKKLLELEPENLKVRVQLGDSLVKANKKDEGIKQYIKAGGQLTAQGHIKEAARMYERAIQLDPNNVSTLEGVVKGHVSQHQGDLALQVLDSLLERHPTAEALLLLKVEVQTEIQQYAQAEETCRGLLASRPASTAIASRLVRLLMAQKKFDEATGVLDGWLAKADPAKLPELEALYEEVSRFAADHLPSLRGLCEVFKHTGKAARLAATLAHIAEIARKAGDLKEAQKVLSELVRLEPHNTQHADDLEAVLRQAGAPRAASVPPPPAPGIEAPPAPPAKPSPPPPPAREPPARPEAIDIDVEVEETGESEIEIAQEDLSIPKVEVTSSLAQSREAPVEQAEEPATEVGAHGALEDSGGRAALRQPAPAAPVKPMDARDAEVIREQLTEAEVFLKYGLTEKAIAELQSILKKLPDHIHAHQKLIAIYKNQKKTDKLVRQILKLAQVFQDQGDEETYETLVEEARAVDPSHKALHALAERGVAPEAGIDLLAVPLAGAPVAPGPPSSPAKPAQPGAREEIELDLGLLTPVTEATAPSRPSEEEEVISLDLELPSAPPPASASGERARPAPPPLVPVEEPMPEEAFTVQLTPDEVSAQNTLEEQLEEAEFYLSQELFGEAQRALAALEKRWPAEPKVGRFKARFEEAQGMPKQAEPEPAAALVELPMEAPSSARAEELFASREEDTASKLELDLSEEATGEDRLEPESLLAEEPTAAEPLMAEAPAEPEAVLDEAPEEKPDLFEAGLKEALAELTAPARPKTKMKVSVKDLLGEEVEAPAPAKDEYYDLASELGAALDGLQAPEETLFEEEAKSPEEMSFEEVFEEFKRGVEKKVGEEDYATHYNLGIAYKEMELLDEAIGEFQLAARSPQFFVECCSMLGLCFRQKGLHELAEKWYRKGLAAPGFPEEIYAGLKYDLAETVAEQGRDDEARDLFKEVYAVNAHYRDIKAKIKHYK